MFKSGVLFFLGLSVLAYIGCSRKTEDEPITSGPDLSIVWEHLGNQTEGMPPGFRSKFAITNTGNEPLPRSGWKLYFNLAREIVAGSAPDFVRITHINGDFYSLAPTGSFRPLMPEDSIEIPFSASAWVINESEAPAGLYLVFQDPDGNELLPVEVSNYNVQPFESPNQINRVPGDQVPVPSPESRFLANEKLSLLPEDDVPKIIPRPVRFDRKSGEFFIDASIPIQHPPELKSEADYLAVSFQSLIGTQLVRVPETEDRSIRLSIGQVAVQNETKVAGDQAYQMIVDPRSGITIIGTDPAGVFYGIQSLRALVAPRSYASEQPRIRIPAVSITDCPLFKYRGQHLDVARNFQTPETVKKLLELMAFYKMNKFHFHITDDEGWRVEIPGVPELTAIGSRRGHTLNESDRLVPSFGSGPDPAYSHGTGFYTRDQFIDILRFAKARHIEVIPEIDLPGHARAAIVSMNRRYDRLIQAGKTREAEEYLLSDPNDESVYKSVQGWRDNVVNVCRESTYTFISKVVDELKSAYSEAEAPFTTVHTGGDEVPSGVWLRSPICNQEIQSKGLEKVQNQKDLPNYFVHRFNQILNERGLITAGWEEIALSGASHGTEKSPNPEFVEKNLLAYVWNSVWGWGGEENAYRLANAGYQVVLCNASNLYLDMAYEKHPLEPGYYWAGFVDTRKPFEFIPYNIYASAVTDLMGKPVDPDLQLRSTGLTPQGRRNVVGIQSQLWSENAKGQDLLEYLVFPKILASAERAWSPQPPWALETNPDRRSAAIESDWNFFVNAIGQREMVRLNFLEGGVNYRIPPPGVIVRDGKLEANTAFPGLIVRYTTDGSEPSENSEIYPGPIRVSGTVKLKAFNSKGRSSRTSEIIN